MDSKAEGAALHRRVVEVSIRIGLLGLVALACFYIVSPFFISIIWGVIIAVAVYPSFLRIERALRGRKILAAVATTALLLLFLLVPVLILSSTLVDGAEQLAAGLQQGTLVIPPPPDAVKSWPLIGEGVDRLWALASGNLGQALLEAAPHITAEARKLISAAARVGLAILQFIVAIFIAGAFLARADHGKHFCGALAERLVGAPGADYVALASDTVRSVTRGVLGVAFIQASLAGLGFLVVGIPAAGFWALIALIVAVVQLPIALVLVPAVIYVFSSESTLTAVLFLAWNIPVALVDNILKPILLGRGVRVPMLVIFVGAIGGLLGFGIIGLFIGAVVLTLAHKLFRTWVYQDALPIEPSR